MKYFIIVLIISATLFIKFPAYAQEIPVFNAVFNLTADPLIPKPGSLVTVRADLLNVSGQPADFRWSLNGVFDAKSSGLNKNAFQFKAGPLGSIYTARVTITLPGGQTLSDSMNFTVSDIDLTWQAKTQAPVDFFGKLLPSQNSTIVVSANPQFFSQGSTGLINPRNLVYNWSRGGALDSANSGLGRSTFIFKTSNDAGENEEIHLEILGQSRTLTADTLIPVVSPEIVLNAKNKEANSYLASTQALFLQTSDQVEIDAKPYFFANPLNQIQWQWFSDNIEIQNSKNESTISLNLKDINSFPFLSTIRVLGSYNSSRPIGNSIQINVFK